MRYTTRQVAIPKTAGNINWGFSHASNDGKFTFQSAKLAEILNLDDETNARSIDTLNIDKAAFILKRHGIHTIGELVAQVSSGLADYRGFGKNKFRILIRGLQEFIDTLDIKTLASDTVEQEVRPPAIRYRGAPLKYHAKNRAKASEETKMLALGQLHLHKEIRNLQRMGIENLDQLFEAFQNGLPKIHGIGKLAKIALFNAVRYADQSINDSGQIDWNRFAELSGIMVIPEPGTPLETGEEFLSSMDRVIASLTSCCFDEVESATLIQRLIPTDKSTATLENIASRFSVSRERIRQKQEIVLNALSSALINNDYENLQFRFSEQFSGYWRDAARHFQSQESLSYFDFIAGLAETWRVSEIQIRPHLPLIYSILTKDSKLPPEFADSSFLPAEVFLINNIADLNRQIRSLHPSRSLVKVTEKSNINTLGLLLSILRSNETPFNRRSLEKIRTEILLPLSRSVSPAGTVIWEKYYDCKKIALLPEADSITPQDFIESAVETVTKFVKNATINGRSEEILIHRILPNAECRKTLSETGELLGCAGPQIKREESELLERLHDAIFGEDYTDSKVHFRNSFIQRWHNAKHICQQAKGIPYFTKLLGLEWNVSGNLPMNVVPMIVSIVKGRPPGYTGKKYSLTLSSPNSITDAQSQPENPPIPSGVIRLRGFRHVH